MSVQPSIEPLGSSAGAMLAIANVIEGRPRELRGIAIRRVFPSAARRMVGPFTFLDEMRGRDFAAREGFDVPPHPHIGLATVTYLFEGALVHSDSLGSHLTIHPGDINWMAAWRGIVHSERTPADQRTPGHRLHGLQLWDSCGWRCLSLMKRIPRIRTAEQAVDGHACPSEGAPDERSPLCDW